MARKKINRRQPRVVAGAEVGEQTGTRVPAESQTGIEKLTKVNSALIRSRQKARDAALASAKPQQADAPEVSSAPSEYPSASDFVRAQPMEKPTKEVLTEAAALGLTVTPNLVRIVRFKMRHAGEPPRQKSAARPKARSRTAALSRAARGPAARGPALGGGSATEDEFKRAVLEVGLSRAKRLLAEIEVGIQAIIVGRS